MTETTLSPGLSLDDLSATALIDEAMIHHALGLLKENEQSLVNEFMPRTGLDYDGTLDEIRKGIRKDAFGFIYRVESRKFVAVLEARKVVPVALVPDYVRDSFDLPSKGYCNMEPGCESCQ